MALLKQENNKYVRLLGNGEFEIYRSEEDRLITKKATPIEIILQKYDELFELNYKELLTYTLENNITEEDFKDIEKWNTLLSTDIELKTLFDACNNINSEKASYEYALQIKDPNYSEFSIMKEIYADVKNSIPRIIESGMTLLKGSTPAEAYEDAKLTGRFGNTIDV